MKHWVDDIPMPDGYEIVKFVSLGRFKDCYDWFTGDINLPWKPYIIYVSFQHSGRNWVVLKVDDPGEVPWAKYNKAVFETILSMIRAEKKKSK